jgi:hypothetical protein
MNALVILSSLVFVAAIILVVVMFLAHKQVMTIAGDMYGRERGFLIEQINAERDARKEASNKFAEILNKMSEDHANELRQTMNMKALGVPVAGDAVVIPQKDDAETRVGKMVREQTIETGAQQIVKRYEEAGLHIEIAEAREQAKALLEGRPISA